jgi:hypothetical protein
MSAGESSRHSYDAARNEILLRMRLRDQVLLVYLMIVGAILGVSLRESGNEDILLSIPFIALGASILVSQHNVLMAILGQFCAEELELFFKKLDPSEYAPHWDNSKTYKAYAMPSTIFRLLSHSLIIMVPAILALGINFKHAFSSPFPQGPLWWFGALCFVGVILVIMYAHSKRKEIYNKRNWAE